jgi:DNA-directed RNA polymerase II subunit RPB2
MERKDKEVDLNEEDIWRVIGSFFDEKGLISQQIESYNLFAVNAVVDHVREYQEMRLVPKEQYKPNPEGTINDEHNEVIYRLQFENVSLIRPSHTEKEGLRRPIFPNEARLRSLTFGLFRLLTNYYCSYSSVMFTNIKKITYRGPDDFEEETLEQIYMGKIPVMLKSFLCHLRDADSQLPSLGECAYDQVLFYLFYLGSYFCRGVIL